MELQARFQAWKDGWQWQGSHLSSLVTLFLSSGFAPSFLHGQALLKI